jgi:hypothetical protein
MDFDIKSITGIDSQYAEYGIIDAFCEIGDFTTLALKSKSKNNIQKRADELINHLVFFGNLPGEWKKFLRDFKRINFDFSNISISKQTGEDIYSRLLDRLESENIKTFIPPLSVRKEVGEGKYITITKSFEPNEYRHPPDPVEEEYEVSTNLKQKTQGDSKDYVHIPIARGIMRHIRKQPELGASKVYFVGLGLETQRNTINIHLKPAKERIVEFEFQLTDARGYLWKVLQTFWKNGVDLRTTTSARLKSGKFNVIQLDFTANIDTSSYSMIDINNLEQIIRAQFEEVDIEREDIHSIKIRKVMEYFPFKKELFFANIHFLERNDKEHKWISKYIYLPIQYSSDSSKDKELEGENKVIEDEQRKRDATHLSNNLRGFKSLPNMTGTTAIKFRDKRYRSKKTVVGKKGKYAVFYYIDNFESIKHFEGDINTIQSSMLFLLTHPPRNKNDFLKKTERLLYEEIYKKARNTDKVNTRRKRD